VESGGQGRRKNHEINSLLIEVKVVVKGLDSSRKGGKDDEKLFQAYEFTENRTLVKNSKKEP